jgi:hypothetical protein
MNDPKKGVPITITREELHNRVWRTPLGDLAREFGIAHRRLVEICHQLAVPYPPRNYWQRMKTGEAVVASELPKPSPDTPPYVLIGPTEKKPRARNSAAAWRPLIAVWQLQRAQARSGHSQLASTPIWTHDELRALKILNAVFREVEKHGLVPRDSRQWRRFSGCLPLRGAIFRLFVRKIYFNMLSQNLGIA